MRLRLAPLLILVVLSFSAHAQPAEVRLDTVVVRPVGPGMTYVRIEAPTVPWSIDVLELTPSDPYLEIKTVEAHDLRAGGYETTSSMAARLDAPGHRVVGAINGDFFTGAGETISTAVSDGQVVRRERPGYPSVGFDVGNVPFLSRPVVGGEVRTESARLSITGYNEPRGEGALVLFNSFRGTSTGTNAFGTEVLIRPLTRWVVNDTVDAVVEAVETGVGDMAIPRGLAVLSAHGGSADLLREVSVGETVRVYTEALPGRPRLEDMISGNPILVLSGVPDPLDGGAFNTDRHPRTAVGFNADATRIFFVTVDGRQAASAGMTNFELRDFMVRIGASDAINLDGGGSTAMVIRGGLANTPSGTERPVGNALIAVSTAPTGPLAHLQPAPTRASLFLGESMRISVSGADEFYNPLAIDPAVVSYSVDPDLGSVAPDGLFTAHADRAAEGVGYVHVAYGGLTDSVRVEVKGVGRVVVAPKTVVTDTIRSVTFSATAYDTAGLRQSIPPGEIAWVGLDEAVGEVTADGVFRGRAEGTARVVAIYSDTVRDTSTVSVQVGQGDTVLDPLDDVGGWQVTGQMVEDVSVEAVDDPAATGGRALRVRYRFTRSSSGVPALRLHADLPVFGVPDSATVRVRSNGERHRVFFLFENGAGTPFSVSVPRYADEETYTRMPGPFTRAVPSAALAFPVRLVGVDVLLNTVGTALGETYEGELYFDDLRVSYPSRSTTTEVGPGEASGFFLEAVYPNPSQTSATVTLRVGSPGEARVILYDLLGRAVKAVYDGPVVAGEQAIRVDVSGIPSGMYMLRADRGGVVAGSAVKLVVLR